jgi:hypothetical protein
MKLEKIIQKMKPLATTGLAVAMMVGCGDTSSPNQSPSDSTKPVYEQPTTTRDAGYTPQRNPSSYVDAGRGQPEPMDPTDCENNETKSCGPCNYGTQSCADGFWSSCRVPGLVELCDGKDNNCDGQTDEGFNLGQTCYLGESICRDEGVYICSDDTRTSICTATPLEPQIEVCDGTDNNCDGEIDRIVSTLCQDETLDCLDQRVIQSLPGNPVRVVFQPYGTNNGFMLLWNVAPSDIYSAQEFSFDGSLLGNTFSVPGSNAESPSRFCFIYEGITNMSVGENSMVVMNRDALRFLDRSGNMIHEHCVQALHDQGVYSSGNEAGFYWSGDFRGDNFVTVGYADMADNGVNAWEIFGEVFDRRGNVVQQRRDLCPECPGADVYPEIAVGNTGSLVMWENDNRILLRTFDANFNPLSSPYEVATTDAPAQYSLAALNDGRYVAAWHSWDEAAVLKVQTFSRTGDPGCLYVTEHAPTGASSIRVTPTNDGSFLVAWLQDLYNTYAAQRFTNGGIPIGERIKHELEFSTPYLQERSFVGLENSFAKIDYGDGAFSLKMIPGN